MIAAAIQGKDFERAGTLLQLGIINLELVYPAADGEVVLLPSGNAGRLISWCVEAGVAPESWLTDEDWSGYDFKLIQGQPLAIPFADVIAAIGRWSALNTKSDLLDRGIETGLTLAPVSNVADVLGFKHLHERGYWQPYELPGGQSVLFPGPFVRLSATPISYRCPAPRLGEHTAEILAERRGPAPLPAPNPAPGLPFAGLKVADFSWIGVGPITAKYFADHGATVVRVETGAPPDRLRNAGPHKDSLPGINRSQFYGAFNTSKQGIVLNLKTAEGKRAALKLLEWCDIAFESFTPGTMKDLGLDYQTAKKLNPSVIMVSSCLMGQTGPASRLAGYGYHAAAISGFFQVTGWPDRRPGGPWNAYTDVIAPHFLAATVAAAIDHRRRTGEGQHVDQAQMESALYFLAPELADYQISGRIPFRDGNVDLVATPHNAYPCQGDDQWIAIACETDLQWLALRAAMGDPAWARAGRFATAEGRRAAAAEIDAALDAWTSPQERYALMDALQAAGVPAGVVQRSSDHLWRDRQLAHRDFFRTLKHPEMGDVPYEGHQFQIAGYPSGPLAPAPCLGEHTVEVLTGILGYTEDELVQALGSGGVGN